MSLEPLETLEAQGFPTVRQLSVFMESRVGQLLRLTKLFDKTEIHIVALSIVNAVDCAIIRMIVDKPDEAYKVWWDTSSRYPNRSCWSSVSPPANAPCCTPGLRSWRAR
jgi:hypothetical protein